MSWSKINEELKKKLSNYKYSFIEAWQLIGCGEKSLRRYMDIELLNPIKISDEWLFTSDLIEKGIFIHKLRTNYRIPVAVGAGIYDYIQSKKKHPYYQDVEYFIKQYKESD